MLARIAANTSKLIVERKQNLGFEKLGELAMETAAPPSFIGALETQQKLGNLSVIAECKAQSPSSGVIREDYDPGSVAREYQQNGAHCISVLTEPDFFGGSDDHISQVRTACGLPVLRKDFMLDTYQVVEARAIGASAILVILAMTIPSVSRQLVEAARDFGLTALVEVHDQAELKESLRLRESFPDVVVIGINSRNLRTLKTDISHAIQLANAEPSLGFCIAESGIRTSADLDQLQDAGFGGILIGEQLLRQPSPGKALAELLCPAED